MSTLQAFRKNMTTRPDTLRFILLALYLLVVLAPLAAAWLTGLEPRSFRHELASGAGMLAFAILLVEFVLSGRFRIASRGAGMDATMRFHQLMARTALVLAVTHPFLYRSIAIDWPWQESGMFAISRRGENLMPGAIAWAGLGLLVAMATWRDRLPIRYGTWRLTHGLGAMVIAGLLFHHALTVGRYASHPVPAILWMALAALAALSLVWVYLLNPLWKRAKPWKVDAISPLSPGVWSLKLIPDGHDGLNYEAGQFAWLNIGRSAFSHDENPFSIASAPSSSALEFIIKEQGDFTRTVAAIQPGTRAFVDGPHGNLVITGRTEPGIALFAGGVGLAPLLSILRELDSSADPRPRMLIHGCRTEAQIVLKDELQRLGENPLTETIFVLSEPPHGWSGHRGMLDADFVHEIFRPEMREWLFILCGPGPMMDGVENALLERGVPAGHILLERFVYD